MNKKYFIPGGDKQIKTLLDQVTVKDFSVLVTGSGCEEISKQFIERGSSEVVIIVQDDDSLLRTRMNLSGKKGISVRLMEFDNTEFKAATFDLFYAQASISTPNRSKIIKEIKRILKSNGYFCVGEIVSLTKTPPQFVKDIWNNSNISPLYSEEIEKFYKDKNFEVIFDKDLSHKLKDFYQLSSKILKEKSNEFSSYKGNYYKKLFKQISHESNAYLKMGGDAHMGFKMLILKKVQ